MGHNTAIMITCGRGQNQGFVHRKAPLCFFSSREGHLNKMQIIGNVTPKERAMFTNGSRDEKFEMLMVNVAWPLELNDV